MDSNSYYIETLLNKIDLSIYLENFINNDLIDEEVILKLQNSDLEKIGISSMGHRIKINDEIQKRKEYKENIKNVNNTKLEDTEKTEPDKGPWGCVGWLLVVLIIIAIVVLIGI
jgi:hypothetical protein